MKILIVDDEQDIRERIARFLEFEQMEVLTAQNGLSAKRMLENEIFAAVVTDLSMPGMDGLGLLKWIKEEGPEIPVIMMSAYGKIAEAVEAMKIGAQDYIVKPFNPEELLIRLRRIIENRRFQEEMELEQRKSLDVQDWIGESPNILEIKALIEKIAPTLSMVLITGESGTGKEVIARAIHQLSLRAKNPFIAINVGGISENLLESELFGYEKGAFTGATSRKIGMFELAASGTLFLDEIGDMPMHLQVKLLRVLQERKIQRLGSTQSLPIDVRILSATNRSLEDRIKNGLFREDLYYRLKVIQITLPPLRERQEDIPLLADHFLKKCNSVMGKSVHGIASNAIKALQNYSFPGNIRELENIIERAVILADTEMITLKDLEVSSTAPKAFVKKGTLDDIQKQAIREALLRCEGNRTKAAEELGITRQTILNKIKEYGLEDL
jgi:two-component system response regulator AtoC